MKKLIILVVCSMIAFAAAGQELKPIPGGNGKYGYVNTEGKLVIDHIYDYAWNFSEGLRRLPMKPGREGFPSSVFQIFRRGCAPRRWGRFLLL